MSLGTFNGLKEAIAQYLGQDNLTDVLPRFIDIAEARIAQRVRLRASETFTTRSITAGDTTAALPDVFYGIRSIYIIGTPNYQIEYVTPEQLNNYSPVAGRPKVFTIRGRNILFPGESDGSYSLRIHYWGRIDALTNNNSTNWLTENAPHVMLYGSLQAAAEYIGDAEQEQKWGALFSQALAELAESDKMQTYGPAPVMRTETQRW